MRLLLIFLLLSSCTVPRLAGPTVDDLAGCPIYLGQSIDQGFYQPVQMPTITFEGNAVHEWVIDGSMGVTNTPMWIGEPFEEPQCDHFYIKQAHTVTDTIQACSEYQACICIYCKEINVCK